MNKREEIFKEFMGNAFSPEDTHTMCTVLALRGFFKAPASTRFHGAYEGGLFDHSYEVAKTLVDITEKLGLQWRDPRSPYLVGMLHDLCKCDNYVFDEKEGKFVCVKDLPLTGHGDKSVILAQIAVSLTRDSFQYLTDEEILCIRWHMGAFDEKENWEAYGKACELYPNVIYTHTADMLASKVAGI